VRPRPVAYADTNTSYTSEAKAAAGGKGDTVREQAIAQLK